MKNEGPHTVYKKGSSRPLCQAHLGESLLYVSCFCLGLKGYCSYRVWFGAESKNECESDRPMRAQLGSTVFVVRGRSSSFYTFFQDCVRGQHLCLAHAERSSSHPHKQIVRFCRTFSGIDHKLYSTIKLKMSKNSVKTILITLCSSAVQDPEPPTTKNFPVVGLGVTNSCNNPKHLVSSISWPDTGNYDGEM